MRTAITVGKRHETGEWELIASPDIPVGEQLKKFRDLSNTRASDEFCFVQFQESDGMKRSVHLNTISQQAKIDAQRKKEQDDAAKAARSAEKDPAKELQALNQKRDEVRRAGLAQIPPIPPHMVLGAKIKAPALGSLRTDGPAPEEWVAAGYDMKNYPPTGYAAKPSAAATEKQTQQNKKQNENVK